eukprot:g13543.t1
MATETAHPDKHVAVGTSFSLVRKPAPKVIGPPKGWQPINVKELWNYRELFLIFALRDIKVRYKQTALGAAWALIQPIAFTVIGMVIFGKVAGAGTDGVTPVFLFYLASQLPWMLFNTGLQTSSMSLVNAQNMIKKIYFPRLVLPTSAVMVTLVDAFILFSLLTFVIAALPFIPGVESHVLPIQALLLPAAVLWAFLAALSIGLPLAALNVEFRDVRYVLPFVTQFMIFAAPVFWPVSAIPEAWRLFYGLIPCAGPIEFFRWCLLGTPAHPEIEGVGKRYRIGVGKGGKYQYDYLGSKLAGLARRPWSVFTDYRKMNENNSFWALKDINLDINRGEVIGVIGRNGAGKSTLLKVLSQITKPTTGTITLHGRVGSLLEVGTGFHPELSGRENIFLNGAVLGMTNEEVKAKFDEIVAFSEIEKFIDTPVKQYSSGMYTRLAFAVAAHLEPEILVVDEVLAVGDAEFQKKCLGKMKDVANGGRTVLFVSHNMAAISRLCDRCAMLEKGTLAHAGPTHDVLERYTRASSQSNPMEMADEVSHVLSVDQVDVSVQPPSEDEPKKGPSLSFSLTGQVHHERRISLELGVYDPYGNMIAFYGQGHKTGTSPTHKPGTLELNKTFSLPYGIHSGSYRIGIWLVEHNIKVWYANQHTAEIDVSAGLPAFADGAADVEQARKLIEQGKPGEAFELLKESGSEERLGTDPDYVLAFADAAWRHAPSQPGFVFNGGDQQSELYVGAAELYRSVIKMASASKAQKNRAEVGIIELRNTLFAKTNELLKKAEESSKKDDFFEALRLAQIMAMAEPENKIGALMILEVGQKSKEDGIRLTGLRLLVRTKPEDASAYVYAANLEAEPKLGDGKEAALAHIDAGLAVLPRDPSLLHERARWLIELQRKGEAIKAAAVYEEAIKQLSKEKKYYAIHCTMAGKLNEQLVQDDKAIYFYQQAVDADPTQVNARYLLGAMHYERGINALLKIIDLPEDGDNVDEIAALHANAKTSLKAARPHLEYYHENTKPDVSVMSTLRELYQQLGDDEAFLKMTKDIRKIQRGEPIR